jgi:hypothetical protein
VAELRAFYHCAHVLDEARTTRLFQASEVCAEICRIISASQKFAVPDNCEILRLSPAGVRKALQEFPIRLPYESVVLEFAGDADGGGKDKLVLAMEQIGDNIQCYRVHNREARESRKQWVADNVRYDFIGISGHSPTIGLHHADFGTFDDWPEYYKDMAALILGSVVEFCAALACKNVDARDVIVPPEKLNRARVRRGKSPLHVYRVLSISGQSANSDDRGGTHASPRIHLRRGHIRRLPIGPVWVNACVVGDKSRGIVTKDYAVVARV